MPGGWGPCMPRVGMCARGYACLGGHAWPLGACVPGVCVCLGGHVCPGDMHAWGHFFPGGVCMPGGVMIPPGMIPRDMVG